MIYAEKKNILNDVVENAVDDYEDDYRTLQFKLICLSLSSASGMNTTNNYFPLKLSLRVACFRCRHASQSYFIFFDKCFKKPLDSVTEK